MSNRHGNKKLKCTHCSYKCVNKSHMRDHVHCHKGGLHCIDCGKDYPTKRMLEKHRELHGQRIIFLCTQYELKYAMANSLHIHIHGKHGIGFKCKPVSEGMAQ